MSQLGWRRKSVRPLPFRHFHVALLLVVLGAFTLTHLPRLDEPFLVGHEGFNGAFFATSARNTLRFGLLATKAGPTPKYFGDSPPRAKDFYTSTPYGYPLLLAGTYGVFGMSERAGRSLSLTFCLALITAFYLFGRATGAPLGGLVAAAAAASLPITHEFGAMTLGQIPSLVFVLGLYLAYFSYLGSGAARALWGVALCLLLAGLLDWHVYCHVPVLMLHFAWREGKERRRWVGFCLFLLLAAALPLFLFLVHTYWLGGFSYLIGKLKQRTGLAPAVRYTWSGFAFVFWRWLRLMYKPATVLAAVVGLVVPTGREGAILKQAARLSAAGALAETLFLSEAIYIHVYYTFGWILPVCLAIGALAQSAAKTVGELTVGALASLLLLLLFVAASGQARAHLDASERQSLALVRVGKKLGSELRQGEIVLLRNPGIQFVPQLKYYLQHEFILRPNIQTTAALEAQCPACRFLLMPLNPEDQAGQRFEREASARYPRRIIEGYQVFDLRGASPGPSPPPR